MKILKYIFIHTLCLLQLYSAEFSTPLGPANKEKEHILGILLGFGQNMQNGIMYVDCEDCQFENGVGFGYTFGFLYERQIARNDDAPFLSNVFYGAILHLSNRNVSASYREIRNTEFNEYDANIPLLYRQKNEINIMNVGLTPYISYLPLKYVFIRLGLDGSVVFNANTKHTTELLDRRKTMPNDEIVDVYIGNNRKTYSLVLQDSPIKDIKRIQLGLMPMLGGNIYFSDKFIISPSFSYYIPFQNLIDKGDLSIHSWRLNFEFKYNLATDERTYKSKKKPPIPPVSVRKR